MVFLKSRFNTKSSETEDKINNHDHDNYTTTQEFNKLTTDNFTARLKETNLASQNDIAIFVNKTSFDIKLFSFNKKEIT